MSSINRTAPRQMVQTFEGASVPALKDPAKSLRRLVMANMLWEDQFYIDGASHADLVTKAVAKTDPKLVQDIALEAREKFKLRHVPLLLMRELAKAGKMQASALSAVIQRPDEISEFISLYWKDKKQPLANQVKKGLAQAFLKFNEYQFAKWNKNSAAVKLRDALFLVHAKPTNLVQADLFKKIASDTLETPDTWETELSSGADKAATFTRLMDEKKLGALAFLRNLRNMVNSGVSESKIREYGSTVNVDKVLPFRYVAAARIMPQFEDMLEAMMFRSLSTHEKLKGKTVLLVDVSGSMFGTKVSNKSDLDRFDAAAALAILAREICEEVEIYSFTTQVVRVPPRRGFALISALKSSQRPGGTATGNAVRSINTDTSYDRIVIFTDEQSSDTVPSPKGMGYIVNVATYQNGINHGKYLTISGFSEAVIDYIQEVEKEQ